MANKNYMRLESIFLLKCCSLLPAQSHISSWSWKSYKMENQEGKINRARKIKENFEWYSHTFIQSLLVHRHLHALQVWYYTFKNYWNREILQTSLSLANCPFVLFSTFTKLVHRKSHWKVIYHYWIGINLLSQAWAGLLRINGLFWGSANPSDTVNNRGYSLYMSEWKSC